MQLNFLFTEFDLLFRFFTITRLVLHQILLLELWPHEIFRIVSSLTLKTFL